jgi:hypothetical protein
VTKFILHLQSTPDCRDPIKALRRLLKHALRICQLRATHISEIPAPESAPDNRQGIVPAENYAQGGDI